MTAPHSGAILCAVRGRPESRATVSYAIDLALQRNTHLTFLHVVDAEFLGYATVGPLSVIYEELKSMAEFAMLILVDRANRRGLTSVDYHIVEGNIRRQLRQHVDETQANTLVLGLPGMTAGRPLFKLEEFDRFVEQIRHETQIEVLVVDAG